MKDNGEKKVNKFVSLCLKSVHAAYNRPLVSQSSYDKKDSMPLKILQKEVSFSSYI